MADDEAVERPPFDGLGWVVAGAVVLVLLGIVYVIRSSHLDDGGTAEVNAALDAIGIDRDDPTVSRNDGFRLSIDPTAPECRGAGSKPQSQRMNARVRDVEQSPDEVVDALVRHYRGTDADLRLYEPDPGVEVSTEYVVWMVDETRHRHLVVFIDRDGTLDLIGLGSDCSMTPYAGPPYGGYTEIPLDR